MIQKITKPGIGIQFILIAILTLIPIFRASAADGDEFEVDGIKYTVISEADKTCSTKGGYKVVSTSDFIPGNRVSGDVILPSKPNGYTLIKIGGYGFVGCSGLTSITLPETVTSISGDAFRSCSNLTSINIPEDVSFIGDSAFGYCTSLKSLTIPASTWYLGDYMVTGCSLKSLILQGNFTNSSKVSFLSGLNSGSILCKSSSLNALKNLLKNSSFKNSIFAYDLPYNISYTPTPTGCSLIITENTHCLFNEWSDYQIKFDTVEYNENEEKISETFFTLSNVEPGDYNITGVPMGTNVDMTISWKADGKEYSDIFSFTTTKSELISRINSTSTCVSITIDGIYYSDDPSLDVSEVGVYFRGNKYPLEDKILIENLNIGTFYPFIPYLLYNGGKDEYKGKIKDICTSGVDFNINYSNTQTSITITDILVTPSDEFEILEKGIEYKGTTYKLTDKIILDDLCPQNTYSVYPYIVYRDANTRYRNNRYDLSTKAWDKTPSVVVGPTSLVLKGNFFDSNEVEPTECWWIVAGETYQGKNVVVTGLNPNTKYTPVFNWTYESPQNEKKTYTSNTFPKEWTTPALTLKTLAPKCVSSTCAIVAAETNIKDVEPMVGFQWKKYDAPATLAPNEGFGAVCDGVVEGYIKNLQSAFYYNVRAFYKNAAGNYYYSDWVTFDPSDFSFFEPTVRTYPVQEVSANTAMVRGYALAGTENIKSQGFQYWASSGPSNAKMYAPANSEVTTVVATGQIMTATFEDLLPGTSYTYRAFVETDAGFTFGDEQKFTTNESPSSYVEIIVSENEAPVIIGYFDLSGRRYSVMQPGMNIIVYSDGSTRKVMNR